MTLDHTTANLFDHVLELPSSLARRRLDALVGLDYVKERMRKQTSILLKPANLDDWSERHHGRILPLISRLRQRPPLVIIAGDIGTGKTTLAETFADPVARDEKIQVRLMRLSLRSRGRGAAGDMTSMIGTAFDLVREKARIMNAVVLVIDEADALAQSRALTAMHHEDRAGVNALIRGIDSLISEGLPVVTVMCTNRLEALDPAVRRRAADVYVLERPGEAERRRVLQVVLEGSGLSDADLDELARLTGDTRGQGYGYTYSDIVEKLVPSAVLDAYPDRPVTMELLRKQIELVPPTRPFATGDD